MPTVPYTDDEIRRALDAVARTGSNSAAARDLGMTRTSLVARLRAGEKRNLLTRETKANPSRWRPGDEIVAARKAEFERVRASAYTGGVVHRPDDGPFTVERSARD